MSTLRMTVIGGGSVGLGFAASSSRAGARVTLMVRSASVEALRTQPLTVAGMFGEHRLEPGRIAIEDADHPTQACLDCDVLVVTTGQRACGGGLQRCTSWSAAITKGKVCFTAVNSGD